MKKLLALSIVALVSAACGGRSSLQSTEVVYLYADGSAAGTGTADAGGFVAHLLDGGSVLVLPDGGEIPLPPGGQEGPDAGSIAQLPDGGLVLVAPDGGTEPVLPDGGVVVDGGMIPSDAGRDAMADAAADAGAVGLIACGTASCRAATQECCIQFGGAGGATPTCTARGACMGLPLSCTSSANCAGGGVCCLSFGGMAAGASCRATCGGGGPGGGLAVCTSNAGCNAGSRCLAIPLGVSICVPRAMGGGGGIVSDRNLKRDVQPVDEKAILERVAKMPISTWSYKADDPSIRHMGPMAQDFHSAFGLGDTDRGYYPVDAHGVALAAIKALAEQVREQDARIEQLERQNRELGARAACGK